MIAWIAAAVGASICLLNFWNSVLRPRALARFRSPEPEHSYVSPIVLLGSLALGYAWMYSLRDLESSALDVAVWTLILLDTGGPLAFAASQMFAWRSKPSPSRTWQAQQTPPRESGDRLGPQTIQLLKLLRELDALLASRGEDHWRAWFAESARRLENSDRSGLRHLLQAYGGMGSFNDLAESAGSPLDRLSSEIHRLATEILRESVVGDDASG
ncbi:MAG: hypothetical protein JNM84_24000 [Planctomycetes bacterium]|nr:hypothetical protein [Planctomycetota bacterium]